MKAVLVTLLKSEAVSRKLTCNRREPDQDLDKEAPKKD